MIDDGTVAGAVPEDVLLLLGADVPTTKAAVFAYAIEDWRSAVEQVASVAAAWPDDYASSADRAVDGSIAIDSGIGFFVAVVMLSALGWDALPADDLRNAKFTSVESISDLVHRVAQDHRKRA